MPGLETTDYLVIALYMLGIVFVGYWAGTRQQMTSLADFFLADRKLPWWILGTSMVATTLAADTPLAVAGLTINKGVAGNWFWWSAAISHVLVSVALARMWRRSGVVTDAELCSLRYQGRPASILRNLKAFYMAVPINCIAMGWVFLAMIKVGGVILPEFSGWQIIAGLLALTLLYSLRSGFAGVVMTDLIQFPIALVGTLILSFYVVDAAGGLEAVVDAAVARSGPAAIDLFPTDGDLLPWHTLFAFLAIQWWAQKYSDGGGLIVQRMLSARSERDAELGGLWFCFAHYILRPWPWILTGMAAIVLIPDEVLNADPEGSYALLIMQELPAGLRGLLVASFLAAFMSTIDTHLNWGASYLTNDIIAPNMDLKPEQIPRIARLCVVIIACIAVGLSMMMDTIAGAWEFLLVLGAGSGAAVLLRWYWWRITAQAEIAAMIASSLLAMIAYTVGAEWSYLQKLMLVVFGSAVIWVPTTFLTSPNPSDLGDFYHRVRPPGSGWLRVATAIEAPQPDKLGGHLVRWFVALCGILLCLLGTGSALFGKPLGGLLAVLTGLGCMLWIAQQSEKQSP